MPTPGLSLVGFLDREPALAHLRSACMWPQPFPDDAFLEAEWQAASNGLGLPTPGAGEPEILEIPDSHKPYVGALTQCEWYQRNAANWFAGATFQMVEIEPLLAYQMTIDSDRSLHHCGQMTGPPSLDDLFGLALPHILPAEQWDWTPGPQSLIVRSRSTNVRSLAQGMFPAPDGTLAGLYFGSAAPLVHVVRLNGRCYLHNGFHRTYGARMAGATHIPCVLRDVADAAQAAIQPPNTFSLDLLESANPPTVAHFTQGRAHIVQLRAIARVLHFSWAEYALPIE